MTALIAKLTEILEQKKCRCKQRPIGVCPQCGCALRAVTRDPGSPLNEEQFDSVRAGDWYCITCKGTEAATGYKYWWDRDLQNSTVKCDYCLREKPLAEALLKVAEWKCNHCGGTGIGRDGHYEFRCHVCPPIREALAELEKALETREQRFTLTFPLENGVDLKVHMGREGLNHFADFLGSLAIDEESERSK